jgi:hypothetical protein
MCAAVAPLPGTGYTSCSPVLAQLATALGSKNDVPAWHGCATMRAALHWLAPGCCMVWWLLAADAGTGQEACSRGCCCAAAIPPCLLRCSTLSGGLLPLAGATRGVAVSSFKGTGWPLLLCRY